MRRAQSCSSMHTAHICGAHMHALRSTSGIHLHLSHARTAQHLRHTSAALTCMRCTVPQAPGL